MERCARYGADGVLLTPPLPRERRKSPALCRVHLMTAFISTEYFGISPSPSPVLFTRINLPIWEMKYRGRTNKLLWKIHKEVILAHSHTARKQ